MASGSSVGHGKRECEPEWKLKKIKDIWFLDVYGKLKRLKILSKAKDVHLEDNIIFADDKIYQLCVNSDGNVLISEVEDVKEEIVTASHVVTASISTPNIPTLYKRKSNVRQAESCEDIANDIHLSNTAPDLENINEEDSTQLSNNGDDSLNSSNADEFLDKGHEEVLADDPTTPNENIESDVSLLCRDEKQCLEKSHRVVLFDEAAASVNSKQYPKAKKRSGKGALGRFFQRIANVVTGKPDRIQKEETDHYDSVDITTEQEVEKNTSEVRDDHPYENIDILQNPGETVKVHALLDFHVIYSNGVSFSKGDKLEVEDNIKSPVSETWWLATHLKTGQEGYVPSNYFTKNDWWFNLDRKSVENYLLLPFNKAGTFLLRDSKEGNSFVLSVKGFNPTTNHVYVKHYLVKHSEESGFYIKKQQTFNTMFDLIRHYKYNESFGSKLVEPSHKLGDLEVSKKSITIVSTLANGFHGEIYKGKMGNTYVAVKFERERKLKISDYLAVANLMHRLRHNNLVQLIAVCTESKPVWIITELMMNGPLLNYLQNDKGKTIVFGEIIDMASQIANGMTYLELEHVIHNDLKAANIYVGGNSLVKIGQFSNAILMEEGVHKISGGSLSTKWMPLEAMLNGEFSIKTDVWSYGVVLYELITFGKEPYPGMDSCMVEKYLSKGSRMRPSCPDPFYDIMLKCWHQIPDSRPSFEYLQDFFSNYETYVEGGYRTLDEIS